MVFFLEAESFWLGTYLKIYHIFLSKFEIPLSGCFILFLNESRGVLNLVWCYMKRRLTEVVSKNEEKTKR